MSQVPQIDPMIALGLMTFAAGGAGWLAGPVVGTGVFNFRNRKFKTQMAEKEKEFYKRVKRFRVDPSVSSLANPVPGELLCYSLWLKIDNVPQRTRRKRQRLTKFGVQITMVKRFQASLTTEDG